MQESLNLGIFDYLRQLDPEFRDVIAKAKSQLRQADLVSVIQIKLEVNIMEILDLNATLGRTILYSPDVATSSFQQVLYCILRSTNTIPVNTEISQIHVILKVCGTPPVSRYLVNGRALLSEMAMVHHLSVFTCKITEISSVMRYTQVVCYFCPVTGCEGSEGFKYVRVHVPGASEKNLTGLQFTCQVCQSVLTENKALRKLSEKLLMNAIIMDTNSSLFKCYQTMRIICRDDVAMEEYSIGEVINVNGRLVYDTINSQNMQIAFEVSSLTRSDIRALKSAGVTSIPQKFRELYKERGQSPWGFVLALAYICAELITPAGTFVKLKLSLLLSLISSTTKKLNVLCVGNDLLLVFRLLKYFSQLSPGSVVHSAANPLFGEVKVGKNWEADYTLSGGSCLLAHDSVCVIEDVTAISNADEVHLLRALEYGNVLLQAAGKLDPVKSDVKCTIWGAAERRSSSKTKKSLRYQRVNPSLLNLFQLVVFTDDISGDYLDSVANQTIQQAIQTDGNLSNRGMQFEDLKNFIQYATHLNVNFPAPVKSYVARFYLASRQVRKPSEMPSSSLQTMLSLAEGHAKLSLRTEVLIEDAIAGILLYEEILVGLTGYSTINVTYEPHWRADYVDLIFSDQNDNAMSAFRTTLEQFCSSFNTVEMEE